MVQLIAVNERFPITLESYLHLCMAQKVPKVDVEEFSCAIVHHVVAWVTVPYPKHISSYGLACQRFQECPVIFLKSVLDHFLVTSHCELWLYSNFFQEKVHDRSLLKWALPVSLVYMHVCNDGRVVNKFDIASFKSAFHD